MTLEDFKIGHPFICGGNKWLCTDIGTEVIIAVKLEDYHETIATNLMTGTRPYGIPEIVFDWFDQQGCENI